MSSHPVTAQMTRHQYYNGSDALVVFTKIPHGSGKREVGVEIRPDQVVAFGEALAPVLASEDGGDRGHAMWHYDHGRAVPCSSCVSRVETVVAEPNELLVDQTSRPNFDGFIETLKSEIKWLDSLHRDDKTGQKDSDVRSLQELIGNLESIGKKLGYL